MTAYSLCALLRTLCRVYVFRESELVYVKCLNNLCPFLRLGGRNRWWLSLQSTVEPADYRKEGLAKALGLIDSVLVKGVCLKDAEAEEEEAEVEEEKLTFCFNNNMFSP